MTKEEIILRLKDQSCISCMKNGWMWKSDTLLDGTIEISCRLSGFDELLPPELICSKYVYVDYSKSASIQAWLKIARPYVRDL